MKNGLLLLFLLLSLPFACWTCQTSTAKSESATWAPEVELGSLSDRMLAYLPQVPLDSTQIPRTLLDGKLSGTPSKSWTSGFFPGTLWQLYRTSGDLRFRQAAEQWQTFVEKEKWDDSTHDLGFKVYCSFGQAYEATGDTIYRDVFLTAARTLSTRYNPVVGAIRSWDHHAHLWDFPVIIDNMMNLELLFEATRLTGDSSYYQIADQHALTTLQNHFRADHSSYHVVDYNPQTGEVQKKNTHQGYQHESAWSRGQAWGLYGYTVAYRYTQRPEYLQQAQRIASYIFHHPNLPDDLVPYWDYDAPNIPNEPRDASAAAIAAAGLFELSAYVPDSAAQYRVWATEVLQSLSGPDYRCEVAPFWLQHSVGSVPGEFEVDAPIIYADYYYVEACRRSLEAESSDSMSYAQ